MIPEETLDKLVALCKRLRRGCSCDYDDRCNNCDTIVQIKEIVRELP